MVRGFYKICTVIVWLFLFIYELLKYLSLSAVF